MCSVEETGLCQVEGKGKYWHVMICKMDTNVKPVLWGSRSQPLGFATYGCLCQSSSVEVTQVTLPLQVVALVLRDFQRESAPSARALAFIES